MRKRTLVASLVAVALSACSVPDVEPTPLIRKAADGPTRKIPDTVVVERAVQKLVADDSGVFTSQLYIGGGATHFVDSRGSWRFSSQEGEMVMSSTPKEGPVKAWDYRIFEQGFYVRESEGRKDGCWVAIGTPNTPPWTATGASTLPSQVQALMTAKGDKTRSSVTKAQGTVSLAVALGVLGVIWTRAVKSAGDRAFETRVPVTFDIKGERFAGWTVLGRDLLAGLKKIGVEPDQGIAAQLPSYSIKVALERPGSDVDVAAPSATC